LLRKAPVVSNGEGTMNKEGKGPGEIPAIYLLNNNQIHINSHESASMDVIATSSGSLNS
jgi:hypothetical protein